MTEFGVALAMIAMFVWLLLKENSRRGVKTVRAYLFMTALEEGKSVAEANEAARIDPKSIPKGQIRATMLYLQEHHRGRQGPLMKKAEAAGLQW
ncbi:MAG: hypothetical protein JJ920_02980 [Roseitalea sp.]|jgi:hypothetical protein|nr:hypothetical protein [Roseitalea sp.]MBO6723581.1 hypothetical protein [Roseitalea sp.]MBO6741847.1 hypothetical protein [Roseitalea sp.]